MFTVTVNLTSSEWIRIHDNARRQWPGENLSAAEIVRRYVLAGIRTLQNALPDDRARMTHELQASQQAPDEPPPG